jgi:hypothetical protein
LNVGRILAEIDDILREFLCELEHSDVLAGEEDDLGLGYVKKSHVSHIVEDLVETDVLVG